MSLSSLSVIVALLLRAGQAVATVPVGDWPVGLTHDMFDLGASALNDPNGGERRVAADAEDDLDEP